MTSLSLGMAEFTTQASGARSSRHVRLAQAWLDRRRSWRTFVALHALTDHTLRDIGLVRSELRGFARTSARLP